MEFNSREMDNLFTLMLLGACGFVVGQNLTGARGGSGDIAIPTEVICSWASCQGLCPSSGPLEDLRNPTTGPCAEQLRPFGVNVMECQPRGEWEDYKLCISPMKKYECSPILKRQTCFPGYYNETDGLNHTMICWDLNSCATLTDFCMDHGCPTRNPLDPSTSPPPSTRTVNSKTSMPTSRAVTSQAETSQQATSEQAKDGMSTTTMVTTHRTTSSHQEVTILSFLVSNTFIVGIAVGCLIITPCFLCMLVYCLRRRKWREKTQDKRHTEYEMNEAVYQAIGPELPPNHPSMRKEERSTSFATRVSGISYQELDAESRCTDDGISQRSGPTTPVSLDHEYELSPGIPGQNQVEVSFKYRKETKRTNSLAMIYRSESQRNDRIGGSVYTKLNRSDSCIPKGSGNVPAYVTIEPESGVNRNDTRRSSEQRAVIDRPYMALNLAGTEPDRRNSKGVEHRDGSILPRDGVRKVSLQDTDDSRNSYTVLSRSTPVLDLTGTDDLANRDVDNKDATAKPTGDKSGEEESSPPLQERKRDTPRRTMTFPRKKEHADDSFDTGSETPSKSKFRSLKLGRFSRKSRKLKNSSAGELCLDLNIISPTTPPEAGGSSFFTSAIPVGVLATSNNRGITSTEKNHNSPPSDGATDTNQTEDNGSSSLAPAVSAGLGLSSEKNVSTDGNNVTTTDRGETDTHQPEDNGPSVTTSAIPVGVDPTSDIESAKDIPPLAEQAATDTHQPEDVSESLVEEPSTTALEASNLKLPLDSNTNGRDPNKLFPPQAFARSQDAIFDDVLSGEEPFRNRSCSQPIRKTFSPSLHKEYEEIREAWGATYLHDFKIDEESCSEELDQFV